MHIHPNDDAVEDVFPLTFDPIRAIQTSCSVSRLLWPQERLLFSYKVSSFSLHRFTSQSSSWHTRGASHAALRCLTEQRSATGGPRASNGASARTFYFFYIDSQRCSDSSCTWRGGRPCRKGHLLHWGNNTIRGCVRIQLLCCHHNLQHRTACCDLKAPVALKVGACQFDGGWTLPMYVQLSRKSTVVLNGKSINWKSINWDFLKFSKWALHWLHFK